MKVNFSTRPVPEGSARLELGARVRQQLNLSGLTQEQRRQLNTMRGTLDKAVLSNDQLHSLEQELATFQEEGSFGAKSARPDTIQGAIAAQRPVFVGREGDRLLLQLPKAQGKTLTASVALASEQEVQEFLKAFDGLPNESITKFASSLKQAEALMDLGTTDPSTSLRILGAGLVIAGLSAFGESLLGVGLGIVTMIASVTYFGDDLKGKAKRQKSDLEQVVANLVSEVLKDAETPKAHMIPGKALGDDCAPVELGWIHEN